jgi:hypothetical protein
MNWFKVRYPAGTLKEFEEMSAAVAKQDFETAALIRDEMDERHKENQKRLVLYREKVAKEREGR